MPFVNQEHRTKPDLTIPGDRCYVHYRRMVHMWTINPRWTTFDTMAKYLYPDDDKRALFLALLVFFSWKVTDYELEKEIENGGIE